MVTMRWHNKQKQIDAYCLLMRNKPDEVLAILGTKTPTFFT